MKTFFCPDTQTHWPRCFALVDLVSAFASIEKMDFPHLQGKPVAVVNGQHYANSCVITSCYNARLFGVKVGVRLKEAFTMCPELVVRPSRPYRYAEVSGKIMDALRNEITGEALVYSIDEAWIDLTPVLNYYGSVKVIADKIRRTVLDASQLRCSIGISEGMLTAKYAASTNKGNTVIIPPDKIKDKIGDAEIGDICGIGKRIEAYLNKAGVFYCKDMRNIPPSYLKSRFGDHGYRLWSVCADGHDPFEMDLTEKDPKSMGHSKVLPRYDHRHKDLVYGILRRLTERLSNRLRRNGFKTDLFCVGFKGEKGWNGCKVPRNPPTSCTNVLWLVVKAFFDQYWTGEKLFQVYVNAIHLVNNNMPQQMSLFDDGNDDCNDDPIDALKDQINDKFGKHAVQSASELFTNDANMVPVLAFNFQNTGTKNSL